MPRPAPRPPAVPLPSPSTPYSPDNGNSDRFRPPLRHRTSDAQSEASLQQWGNGSAPSALSSSLSSSASSSPMTSPDLAGATSTDAATSSDHERRALARPSRDPSFSVCSTAATILDVASGAPFGTLSRPQSQAARSRSDSSSEGMGLGSGTWGSAALGSGGGGGGGHGGGQSGASGGVLESRSTSLDEGARGGVTSGSEDSTLGFSTGVGMDSLAFEDMESVEEELEGEEDEEEEEGEEDTTYVETAEEDLFFSDSVSMVSLGCSTVTAVEPPCGSSCGLPDIPDCFRCIISGEIMEDPVILEDGRCCDKSSLKNLGYDGPLLENLALKEAIDQYLQLYDSVEQQQLEWSAYFQNHQQRLRTALRGRALQAQSLHAAIEKNLARARSLMPKTPTRRNRTEEAPSESGGGASAAELPFHCGPAPRSGGEGSIEEAAGTSGLDGTESIGLATTSEVGTFAIRRSPWPIGSFKTSRKSLGKFDPNPIKEQPLEEAMENSKQSQDAPLAAGKMKSAEISHRKARGPGFGFRFPWMKRSTA